jgi:5-methyltetrahydropteroyltriglutamate--homocysteine methyltransferase
VRELEPGAILLPPSRDRQAFPEFYAEEDKLHGQMMRRVLILGEKALRERRAIKPSGPERWKCTGPIAYTGQALLQRDIDNLKSALSGVTVTGAFLPVVAPASVYWLHNEYYKTDEEFVFALGSALRTEYRAIVDSGLLLQVDDAVLLHEYDSILALGGSVADYRKWAQVRVNALKHALEGIPEDRVSCRSRCATT